MCSQLVYSVRGRPVIVSATHDSVSLGSTQSRASPSATSKTCRTRWTRTKRSPRTLWTIPRWFTLPGASPCVSWSSVRRSVWQAHAADAFEIPGVAGRQSTKTILTMVTSFGAQFAHVNHTVYHDSPYIFGSSGRSKEEGHVRALLSMQVRMLIPLSLAA